MISDKEITEIRQLAAKIRKLKEGSYDALTWDVVIKKVVSDSARSKDDFFRKTALLKFFVDEDKQLCSLDEFLDGLDFEIADLKERDKDYAISETERLILKKKIDSYFLHIKYPTDRNGAFDYYQVLIDKVFISKTLTELMSLLCELSVILKEYYPSAFQEVHVFSEFRDKLQDIIDISKEGATKKQIASALGVGVELVGTVMYRLTQLGIFEVGKRGRENVYTYKQSDFDVNVIRKEWTWLWSQPYKKLSLKLFDQR